MQIQSNIYACIVTNQVVISLMQAAQTLETTDDRTNQASFIALLEALSFTIDRISHEVITNNYCKNLFL